MRYFISDTHFGHNNVIRYCNRPFKDAYEMDRVIIENWNSIVKPEDTIYHLGDFAFYGVTKTEEIVKALNGYKIIIKGNHDKGLARLRKFGFQEAMDWAEITIGEQELLLSHYPYGSRDGDQDIHKIYHDKGCWILHGHVHTEWKLKDKMINVGVDQWNFKPVSEIEIADTIRSHS